MSYILTGKINKDSKK